MSHFVKYSLDTGLYTGSGSAPDSQVLIQAVEGEGMLFSTKEPVVHYVEDGQMKVDLDFSGVREWLCNTIDAQAGVLRQQFITDVPGQAQAYERKEREARAWTEGDEVLKPALYPFMIAEAEVRGISVAEVRAGILEQVNALTPIAAQIEAHRVSAKAAVNNAVTLGDMAVAGIVDWRSIQIAQ